MTPQIVLEPAAAAANKFRAGHLSETQFGELLTGSPTPDTAAQAHLLVCVPCAAELSAMRESISLFCLASSTYADTELRRLPRIAPPSRRIFSPTLEPTVWVAAAALLLAALLPLQTLRPSTFRAAPASAPSIEAASSQSDEALLEDVDRDTSATLPAPMQSLADPAANASSVSQATSTATQRKD